ncbi:histidine kinase [Streptomyces sp. NPDC052396]|uniref:histidine kinase n=1 Tax=Streptomyces sp. NPDC052396 TaxID=3365689 RepID=UPI0037D947A8
MGDGIQRRLVGWRGRSRAAQVDSFMRWTLYLVPFLFPLACLGALVETGGADRVLRWLLFALCCAQCVVGIGLTKRGLAHYLRGRPAPWLRLAVSGGLFLASVVLLVVLVRITGPVHVTTRIWLVQGSGYIFFGGLSMLLRIRWYLLWSAAGGAALAAAILLGGASAGPAAAVFVVIVVQALWSMTMRSSAWMLSVLWEAESARGVQARLAVAEERLRFGRDMHDVLGRNLTVIALKTELAGQLVRRAEPGSPAALEQLAEVQRIARESQRDMREVVRGYREVDLRTELTGARGVLASAGIDCQVEDSAREVLPGPVQSVLAWVVREGTTNVLRHSDARRCAVRLSVTDGVAVLVVENDGARADDGTGGEGSGLAGLRDRLAALGGALAVERRGRVFRLMAAVGPCGPGVSDLPDGESGPDQGLAECAPMGPRLPGADPGPDHGLGGSAPTGSSVPDRESGPGRESGPARESGPDHSLAERDAKKSASA